MRGATKVVVALGGNALEDKQLPPTAQSQHQVLQRTAQQLSQLSVSGYELAIVHGNGPQVGRILLASETARDVTPPMPFDVCGAMSQGYIGYHIQQTIQQTLTAALRAQGKHIPVVTVVTQVVVDPRDPAFSHPTKPIGPFYTQAQADALTRERGYHMRQDGQRGYRRVVPSPQPQRIVEIGTMKMEGVAAVIDKDLAACRLGIEMEADVLMILTEVPAVALHFGTPQQEDLGEVKAETLEQYAHQGHFGEGSMLPKVKAAIQFARSARGRTAIITSLDRHQPGPGAGGPGGEVRHPGDGLTAHSWLPLWGRCRPLG